jgi:hypothetical protein
MSGFIGISDITGVYSLQLNIAHTHRNRHYCPRSRLPCRCVVAVFNSEPSLSSS